MDQKERFWSHVDKSAGPDACWVWKRSMYRHGYGRGNLGDLHTHASRIAWILTNGPIQPKSLCVLHRCGNRGCVNPAHLKLGTRKDNAQDRIMMGRARGARGEDSFAHKLTWKKVGEIRARHAEGVGYGTLAKEYGVSKITIMHIIRRDTWKG
jgi:hypothetical protein